MKRTILFKICPKKQKARIDYILAFSVWAAGLAQPLSPQTQSLSLLRIEPTVLIPPKTKKALTFVRAFQSGWQDESAHTQISICQYVDFL
ncbi:hypothetical protein HMPREF0765_2031 [Sphingobacterium spiritivorum ATCC 33300]|uniref:Uncharacterized protein n=1 Tax=Sphingobacterium spiritivorum ATCC 33300 TaxID=525372 RepID=C2FXH5_SPHSI|nr:hypothetical protein HMPREF0765_2031 [Sphingobacterium spiritivorum ATCC 33300]